MAKEILFTLVLFSLKNERCFVFLTLAFELPDTADTTDFSFDKKLSFLYFFDRQFQLYKTSMITVS